MSEFKVFGIRHKPGKTCLAFDFIDKRILSASVDGKLRVYANIDDTNPMEYVVGEKVNHMICRNDYVVIATEGSHVYLQQISDGLLDGIATRFTAEVNYLGLNKDKTKLVAGGSDFIVKVIDFTNSDGGTRETVLKGHDGPILSVDFDPLDNFIASSSCDGTIRIWQLKDCKELQSFKLISKCNDPEFSLSPCRIKWEPLNGEFLAIPVDNFVRLYERNTWSFIRGLRCPEIEKPIQECAFSPDGEFFTAISEDGWLVVWCHSDGSIVKKIHDSAFENTCSMIWPERSSIYCANKHGVIGHLHINVIKTKQNDLTLSASSAAPGGLSPNSIRALMKGIDEEDDFDDLMAIAASQAAENAVTATPTETASLDKSDTEEESDTDSIAISRIKSSYMVIEDDNGDDDDMADLNEASAPSKQQLSVQSTSLVQQSPEIKPFQSGSMPSGFRERFLVWNRIGVVTSFAEPDIDDDDFRAGISSAGIEAEFHDTTLHHSLHVKNTVGYTMADLSLTGLLLASPGSSDVSLADNADSGKAVDELDLSIILVRPIGDGDAKASDWLTSLPPGEAARAICLVSNSFNSIRATGPGLSCGYAVVATSARLIRIFAQPASSAVMSTHALRMLQANSLGLPPLSLPGKEVVTMASHPSLPILAVVIGWSNEDLYWRVFNLSDVSTNSPARGWMFGQLSSTWYPLPISRQLRPSPLAPNESARLTWFGFSDIGNLVSADSNGQIRRLVHQRSRTQSDFNWVPVCNTRALVKPANKRNDCYFVVAVVEGVDGTTTGANSSGAAVLLDGGDEEESDRVQRLKADSFGYGQVQAIYCKASKWPRVIPRPMVARLPYRIPLCGGLDLDQADLEENYLRSILAQQEPFWGFPDEEKEELTMLQTQRQGKQKSVLLRLFALATKLDSDWASLSIANLMPDSATVELAIRYAARLRKQHLAARLGEVALRKQELEVAEGGNEVDVDSDEFSVNKSDEDTEASEEEDKENEMESEVDEEDDLELPVSLDVTTVNNSSDAHDSTIDPSSSILNDSSSYRRQNPFKRGSATRGPQAEFRGSSVLDTLKAPLPKPSTSQHLSTKPAAMTKQINTTKNVKASKMRPLQPSKEARKVDMDDVPIKAEKRPPISDIKMSAAKRLSSFAFSDS